MTIVKRENCSTDSIRPLADIPQLCNKKQFKSNEIKRFTQTCALILCQILILNSILNLNNSNQQANRSHRRHLIKVAWAQEIDEPERSTGELNLAAESKPRLKADRLDAIVDDDDDAEPNEPIDTNSESGSSHVDETAKPTSSASLLPLAEVFEPKKIASESRRSSLTSKNKTIEQEDAIDSDEPELARVKKNHRLANSSADSETNNDQLLEDELQEDPADGSKVEEIGGNAMNGSYYDPKRGSLDQDLALDGTNKAGYFKNTYQPKRTIDSLSREQQVPSESHRSMSSMDSNCALILKRTYIVKSQPNDEWGDKFVFNEVEPESSHGRVHKSDLCISYSDLNKAIEEAKHRIKFQRPADLEQSEVSVASIGAIGELNLATGQILSQKFDLSRDEILNALPMIDMSGSKFFTKDLCPRHVKPMICKKSRYRTITAHCNNLKHPTWGAYKTPYSRYLPPDYADGLSLPRASQEGQPLPSARLITSVVHQDVDEPSNDYNTLFASWGQLLNHDVTRHAVSESPDCCPQYLKGNCMPIPVPQNDPLYSEFNVKCLKFDRSIAAIRAKCLLGFRAQINLVTSPIDASFVYGSSKSQADKLRKFKDGQLKSWNYFEKLKLKPLLPPQREQPDNECLGRPKHLFCFEAGDVRANEQTHLTVLHTIYMREHNRIAKQLAKMNLEWDDNKIYHETRHIVAAGVQHVVMNEFLPLLLGKKFAMEHKIWPSDGHWSGYDPGVTTSTGTGFAAAAFRYGHSMVEGTIRRFTNKGHFVKGELLRYLFKRPFLLYEPGVMDQLVMGMVLTATEQTDPFVSEEISGHLFQPPKAKFGHDLPAINIQRGRDQGVPGYNDWREWCGLSRAKSFTDLEPLLMNRTAYHYSRIYRHVDDIDLWSAGVSERKMSGSAVGPTMACIISRQFINSKRGDRFWYENPNQPSSFTPAQLREIKKITLAKILCTNGDDIPKIQPWAMRLPHPIYNAKVNCDQLPTMSLKPWDSNRAEESL